LFNGRRKTLVRLLEDLHAKLIVIDDNVVYCGSANWYQYSLQESRELVLRGPADDAVGLLDELHTIWEMGSEDTPLPHAATGQEVSKGYRAEVVDPIAEAKLDEVPGSFIIRRPHKK
jgi:phosphatidylserine/phosphatidylglycerophosphate/cardiolipin synthase-like enzyme